MEFEIEELGLLGSDKLLDGKDETLSIGFGDQIHSGGEETDKNGRTRKRLRTMAEVAKRISEGDDKPFYLLDDDWNPFRVDGVPPRPFLAEGVQDAIESEDEYIKGVALGKDYDKVRLAEEMKQSVRERMSRYDGDYQNPEYIHYYKRDNPSARLYRTGILSRALEAKWE